MIEVAITYHEDFGARGFSVLKERIKPSFEKLMQSGLVDGREVQVFRPKPAPLALVMRLLSDEQRKLSEASASGGAQSPPLNP